MRTPGHVPNPARNDGFTFDIPIPLGQHISPGLKWKFSNNKPSEFETTV